MGATIGPVADGVGEGIDLDALLGTFRDTETGAVFVTGFDERRGVIVRRDLLTLVIAGRRAGARTLRAPDRHREI